MDGKLNVGDMTPATVTAASSSFICEPATAPIRRAKRSLTIATGGAPSIASAAPNARPCTGHTPSVSNRFGETIDTTTRLGSSAPSVEASPWVNAASDSNARGPRAWSWKSKKSAGDIEFRGIPRGFEDHMRTRRSGWTYGSGRNTTASTTLKIAVLAPIPSASVLIAASG